MAPLVSPRTHTAPVYGPAEVLPTQSGESLMAQMAVVVAPLVSCADQLPLCPPATRASVTAVPEPLVFQRVRSVSKPGLPIRLGSAVTCAVAGGEVCPAVSLAVTVTV